MDEVEGLQVFLVLAVKGFVGRPEPRNWRLVLTVQTIVEVDQRVVLLHILIQGEHEVPEDEDTGLG